MPSPWPCCPASAPSPAMGAPGNARGRAPTRAGRTQAFNAHFIRVYECRTAQKPRGRPGPLQNGDQVREIAPSTRRRLQRSHTNKPNCSNNRRTSRQRALRAWFGPVGTGCTPAALRKKRPGSPTNADTGPFRAFKGPVKHSDLPKASLARAHAAQEHSPTSLRPRHAHAVAARTAVTYKA